MQAKAIAVQDVPGIRAIADGSSKLDDKSVEQSFFDLIGGIMDDHDADALVGEMTKPDFDLAELKMQQPKQQQQAKAEVAEPAADATFVVRAEAEGSTENTEQAETQDLAMEQSSELIAEDAAAAEDEKAPAVLVEANVVAQTAAQLAAQAAPTLVAEEAVTVATEQPTESAVEQGAEDVVDQHQRQMDLGNAEISAEKREFSANERPVVESKPALTGAEASEQNTEPVVANTADGAKSENAAADLLKAARQLSDREAAPNAERPQAPETRTMPAEQLITQAMQPALNKSAVAAGAVSERTQAAAAVALVRAQVEAALQRAANPNQGVEIGARAPLSTFGIDLSQRSQLGARSAGGVERLSRSKQTEVIQQIQKVLEQALQSKTGDSLTLQLKPEELGLITLKVTVRDDRVHARLTPESEAVEGTLRQRASELLQVLTASGFKPENVTLSFGAELADSEAFLLAGENGFKARHEQSAPDQGERRAQSSLSSAELGPVLANELAQPVQGWVA